MPPSSEPSRLETTASPRAQDRGDFREARFREVAPPGRWAPIRRHAASQGETAAEIVVERTLSSRSRSPGRPMSPSRPIGEPNAPGVEGIRGIQVGPPGHRQLRPEASVATVRLTAESHPVSAQGCGQRSVQSRSTNVSKPLWTSRPSLYRMKPSFLKRFMK